MKLRSSHPPPLLSIAFSLILSSTLLALFFLGPAAMWKRVLLLYFSVRILMGLILRLTNSSLNIRITVPAYAHKYAGESVAWSVSALYYIYAGQSSIWKYVCLLLMAWSLYQLMVVTFLSAAATKITNELLRAYKASQLPAMKPPYSIIINVGRGTNPFLKEVIYRLIVSLWRFRYIPSITPTAEMQNIAAMAEAGAE